MKVLLVRLVKLAIVPLLFLALYPIQRRLVGRWQDRFESEIVYLPRGEYLRKIRFGVNDVMADILWIRGFHYVQGQWQLIEAEREKPKEGWHRQLPALYDVITDLDPHFIPAYRGGSLLLAALNKKPKLSIALLEKGVKENPTKWWQLPYEIAVNYVFEFKDDPAAMAEARKWIEVAADKTKYPDTTPQVARMAAWLRSKDKSFEEGCDLAIESWKEWSGSGSKEFRRIADQQIGKWERRKMVYRLNDAIARFEKEKNRMPENLEELVKEKFIAGIPVDPSGGTFYISPKLKRVLLRYPKGVRPPKRQKNPGVVTLVP